MADKTGYGSPPKKTRFKKGRSGNPAGRPKKSKNFLTLLGHELDQSIIVNENGKKAKISKLEAMIKRIVAGALQGDRKSVLTLIDIMRRTERFAEGENDDWLPPDYDKIVDQYIANHLPQSKPEKPNQRRDK